MIHAINAQVPIITTDMIYDSVGQALVTGKKAIEANARYLTNTQTEEEKCNKKYWDYFKQSSHIISDINKENTQMKRLLSNRNIDYRSILRQRVRNITIDENKLRAESCSKNYFEQLIRNEKRKKEVKKENKVLKELMQLNDIQNKKIISYEEEPERKRPKLNMTIIDTKVDLNMQKAIHDVE